MPGSILRIKLKDALLKQMHHLLHIAAGCLTKKYECVACVCDDVVLTWQFASGSSSYSVSDYQYIVVVEKIFLLHHF
jgi:hypothetical protein